MKDSYILGLHTNPSFLEILLKSVLTPTIFMLLAKGKAWVLSFVTRIVSLYDMPNSSRKYMLLYEAHADFMAGLKCLKSATE